MQNNNTTTEMIFAFQDLSKVQVEQFVTIIWSLWKIRNMHVWQNATETSEAVHE